MNAHDDYPEWVCFDCGEAHGRRECGVTTFHAGICDVCGERAYVTDPRDFGHLRETWKAAKAEKGRVMGERGGPAYRRS